MHSASQSMDHLSNRSFLNIPRTKKSRASYFGQMSSLLGTVSYGDFVDLNKTYPSMSSRHDSLITEDTPAKTPRDYEIELKSSRYWESESGDNQPIIQSESADGPHAADLGTKSDGKEDTNKDIMQEKPTECEQSSLMAQQTTDEDTSSSVSSVAEFQQKATDDSTLEALKTTREVDNDCASNCDSSEVLSERSSCTGTPVPSVKVSKPPGGDCSDIFNTGSSYSSPPTHRFYRSQVSRVPWGTEEDLKQTPTQVIPKLQRMNMNGEDSDVQQKSVSRMPATARSNPVTHMEEAFMHGGHSSSVLSRSQSARLSMSAPYGTDENYTRMFTKPKHENHKTQSPWATEQNGGPTHKQGAESGENKDATKRRQQPISSITF